MSTTTQELTMDQVTERTTFTSRRLVIIAAVVIAAIIVVLVASRMSGSSAPPANSSPAVSKAQPVPTTTANTIPSSGSTRDPFAPG